MADTHDEATLTDEEIETRTFGATAQEAADDGDDTSDPADTGDDSGDVADPSDSGDDSGDDAA